MFIQSSDFSNETLTLVCPLPLDYNPLHTNALYVYNHNRLSLIHQRQNTNVIDVGLQTHWLRKLSHGIMCLPSPTKVYLTSIVIMTWATLFTSLTKTTLSLCFAWNVLERRTRTVMMRTMREFLKSGYTKSVGRNTRISQHRIHNFL